jgi:colanic acid/amylovoran biosynthesis glycosyltransferase
MQLNYVIHSLTMKPILDPGKILFLLPYLRLDSEGWMQYLLKGLEHDLTVIGTNNSQGETKWGNQTPVVELTRSGSIFYRTRRKLGRICSRQSVSPSQIWVELLQRNLEKAIRKHQPSAILSHYGDFALIYKEVFDLFDIPVFIHFHGYDATFNFKDYTDPEQPYFAHDYCQKIRNFSTKNYLIANSHFTKSLLINHFGVAEGSVLVNYLGVPQSIHTVEHIDSEPVQILHLGRLVDFKSPDRTIAAFECACDQGLHGNLVIAGDGPMRNMCELLRMRSPYRDRIRFTGSINASMAKQLLLESHILTQHNVTGEISNQRECLGISILEAMAVGLPVVGTNSGAVSETVVSGKTGILVSPGDIEAQARALLQLANSAQLRSQMGRQAILRVQEQFDANTQCDRLKSIMLSPRQHYRLTKSFISC